MGLRKTKKAGEGRQKKNKYPQKQPSVEFQEMAEDVEVACEYCGRPVIAICTCAKGSRDTKRRALRKKK